MPKQTMVYLAELVGTFLLVLIGAGSIIVNTLDFGGISLLGIAAAFGLTVMIITYTIGPISGAQINPAVTLAFYLTKKINQSTALGFIIAQLLGAVLAGYVLLAVFPQTVATTHLGATTLGPTIVPVSGILVEVLLTAFLVLVILMMTTKENHHTGLVVGATVAVNHLFGLSLTGASMNPARSFGPALVSGYWDDQIVWWVGPLAGAVIGYLIWQQMTKK